MRAFKKNATMLEDLIMAQAKNHIRIQTEVFPPPLRLGEFEALFKMHGVEVAGKPFELDYRRYFQLEADGRLVFVVARDDERRLKVTGHADAIGYSCHFWYRDLHFNRRRCADDLWFVLPQYRNRGIGTALKFLGHDMMHYRGCVQATDVIRNQFDHPNLMVGLKYAPRATQWIKDLQAK